MRRALIVLSAILLLTVAACDANTESYKAVNSFWKKWTGATIKQTLRYTLGTPTGSSIVDDLVDSKKEADKLWAADKLWDLAVATDSINVIDQALALRPNDWRYRITRARMLLQAGDTHGFNLELADAEPFKSDDPAVANVTDQEAAIRNQRITELTGLEQSLSTRFKSRSQCTELYGQLRNDLRRRFQEGQGRQADLDTAARYDVAYNNCASLPPP